MEQANEKHVSETNLLLKEMERSLDELRKISKAHHAIPMIAENSAARNTLYEKFVRLRHGFNDTYIHQNYDQLTQANKAISEDFNEYLIQYAHIGTMYAAPSFTEYLLSL